MVVQNDSVWKNETEKISDNTKCFSFKIIIYRNILQDKFKQFEATLIHNSA